MRAAFTLREHKDIEQKPLLEAHLANLPKRQGEAARRHLEGVALGLQNTKWRKQQQQQQQQQNHQQQNNQHHNNAGTGSAGGATTPVPSVVEQTEAARKAAEMERQREEALQREQARRKRLREEEEARQEEIQRSRSIRTSETPNQVLQKYYKPMFEYLWNLEFDVLGGINPFRMVIDKHNCAAVGAPDYFDIIETPMNLTWIQQKVENAEYDSLKAFFNDCSLMITNALKYNSDPSNPYHIAAQELKNKFKAAATELVKKVKSLTKGG